MEHGQKSYSDGLKLFKAYKKFAGCWVGGRLDLVLAQGLGLCIGLAWDVRWAWNWPWLDLDLSLPKLTSPKIRISMLDIFLSCFNIQTRYLFVIFCIFFDILSPVKNKLFMFKTFWFPIWILKFYEHTQSSLSKAYKFQMLGLSLLTASLVLIFSSFFDLSLLSKFLKSS